MASEDTFDYYGAAGMDISTLGEKRMRLNNMLQDMITWVVWHKCAGGEKIFDGDFKSYTRRRRVGLRHSS